MERCCGSVTQDANRLVKAAASAASRRTEIQGRSTICCLAIAVIRALPSKSQVAGMDFDDLRLLFEWDPCGYNEQGRSPSK